MPTPYEACALATDEAQRRLCQVFIPYDPQSVEVLRLRSAMLREAEALFGQRDTAWVIGPVRFSTEKFPRAARPDPNKDYIETWLSECQEFPERLAYQMAHEVIHLLAPTHNESCLFIEEGLAVYFSIYIMKRLSPGYDTCKRHTRYKEALEAYSLAHAIRPEFISEARKVTPCLSKFSPSLLKQTVPGLAPAVAEKLCQPFGDAYQDIADGAG